MTIQRYTFGTLKPDRDSESGEFVRYEEHVTAMQRNARDDLPALTPAEYAAMESVDMTSVLGTWEERYRVVMDASKKMLRANRALRDEVAQLKQALDKATDVLNRVAHEYPSVVQPCGCGESEACSSCEITFVLNRWQTENADETAHAVKST